jgi:hypothetical protein
MVILFDVSGQLFALPEPQATNLAEKLRLFAKGNYPNDRLLLARRGASEEWIDGALAAADSMEASLVGALTDPLPLEGMAADAVFQVLRISYVDATDRTGAAGLRDALAEQLAA